MVHLIECCDGKSMALYKHINSVATRDVRWRVSWWMENDDGKGGCWKSGVAQYYGRLSNVLHISQDGSSDDQLIEVGVDENLKLCEVLTTNGGHADFECVHHASHTVPHRPLFLRFFLRRTEWWSEQATRC